MNKRFSTRLLSLVLATLAAAATASATQVALVGDASVNTARPSTNFGTLSNLYVGNGNTAFLQFDLSTLPAGLTASQVSHATLTPFITASRDRLRDPRACHLRLDRVRRHRLHGPAIGAATSTFTASAAGQYVTLDVTSLVQGWITTPATNFGLALSSAATNLLLDSKENDETGRAALHRGHAIGGGAIAFALLLLPFTRRLRRRARQMKRLHQTTLAVTLLLCAAALGSITGCGTDTGFFAQPQQNYTITVTGTATGSNGYVLQHSTNVTLTVQ